MTKIWLIFYIYFIIIFLRYNQKNSKNGVCKMQMSGAQMVCEAIIAEGV